MHRRFLSSGKNSFKSCYERLIFKIFRRIIFFFNFGSKDIFRVKNSRPLENNAKILKKLVFKNQKFLQPTSVSLVSSFFFRVFSLTSSTFSFNFFSTSPLFRSASFISTILSERIFFMKLLISLSSAFICNCFVLVFFQLQIFKLS